LGAEEQGILLGEKREGRAGKARSGKNNLEEQKDAQIPGEGRPKPLKRGGEKVSEKTNRVGR